MNVMPFIPKDDQELPDNYGMKITYLSGKSEEIEIASHKIIDCVVVPCLSGDFFDGMKKFRYEPSNCPFLEFVTKDDKWGWIPMSSIQRLEFDKRFSKIMAIKEKLSKKVDA